MGRHSVPDDDADAVETVATEPPEPPESDHSAAMLVLPRGRHSRSEDGWIEADATAVNAAPAEAGRRGTDPALRLPTEPGTRGDLQLLRQSASLRARCAAAAIVPF